MKKKITGVTLVVAMVVVGGWNFSQNANKKNVVDFVLENIESVAACEFSSNPIDNPGYCLKLVDGSGEMCLTIGNDGAPRCSHTIF